MKTQFSLIRAENNFQIETRCYAPTLSSLDVKVSELKNQVHLMKPPLNEPPGAKRPVITKAESRLTCSKKTTLPSLVFPKTLEEKREACDQFQIGDVIATHITSYRGVEFFDPLIEMVQVIAKWLGFSDKNAKSTAIHIAIVVGIDRKEGRVIISEAMPSRGAGLRTVDLFSHNSCVLKPGAGYEYEIYRPKQPYAMTAVKAAAIAERFAPKAAYLLSEEDRAKISEEKKNESRNKIKPLMNKFSFTIALKAMFNHKEMSEAAQKRIFKGIFEEAIHSHLLIGGKKGRKIFCSAFGSQVFQKAVAEKAWNELIAENPGIQQGLERLIEQVEGKDNVNQDKIVSHWAKEMQKKYGKALEKKMGVFSYDFMKMAPQDMLEHFKRNDIASEEFRIIPLSTSNT